MPSTFWMFIIVVSAFSFAAANIYYPRAKEAEEKRSVAITIEKILKPELESNLEIANNLKTNPINNLEHFETGAWSVISSGNLLLGVGSQRREDLIKVYVLINKANEYHSRILDIGTGTVWNEAVRTRGQLVSSLLYTIDKLIPLLSSLTENK